MLITQKLSKFNLIIFLPLIPIFNLYIKNYYILNANEKIKLFSTTIIIYFFIFIINLLSSKSNKNILNFLLVWFNLLFNYLNITNYAFNNFPPVITRINNYAFYFYIFVFITVTFIFKIFYINKAFQTFINIFVILSFISPSIYFFAEESKNEDVVINLNQEKNIELQQKPDVYFIIFDNMANFNILEKYYGFDTSQTKKALQENGFFIYDESFSVYGQTRLSISSILNLDYLFPEGKLSFSTRKNILNQTLTVNSIVYNTFLENGYEIFAIGEDIPCELKKIKCIKYNVNDTFLYSLLINTPYSIIVNNRNNVPEIYSFINKLLKIDCSPDCKEISFEEVIHRIKLIDDPYKPNFIIIQNMNSHKPFRVNENCENIESIKFNSAIYNIEEYIDSIYCNVKELDYLSKIVDENSIIITQSDHGPNYFGSYETFNTMTEDDMYSKFFTFAAVKGVESYCQNFENLNFYGVNTFRSLFTCLNVENNISMLQTKSFYASYGTKSGEINYGFEDIIDITNYLKNFKK